MSAPLSSGKRVERIVEIQLNSADAHVRQVGGRGRHGRRLHEHRPNLGKGR